MSSTQAVATPPTVDTAAALASTSPTPTSMSTEEVFWRIGLVSFWTSFLLGHLLAAWNPLGVIGLLLVYASAIVCLVSMTSFVVIAIKAKRTEAGLR